ncbi:hypothetical protein B7463_g5850, partial [Scytalidium lignicola]
MPAQVQNFQNPCTVDERELPLDDEELAMMRMEAEEENRLAQEELGDSTYQFEFVHDENTEWLRSSEWPRWFRNRPLHIIVAASKIPCVQDTAYSIGHWAGQELNVVPTMEYTPRQPPVVHAPTYSSLTDEPLQKSTKINPIANLREQELLQAPALKFAVPDGWVLARWSRVPSKAWNRQSILVFADFNTFESSRGSRSQRRAEHDEESGEDEEDLDDAPSQGPNYSSKYSIYSIEKPLPQPPYHVFTAAKKKQLVYIVSLAGLFSPLSSNIYFPALGQIATDLSVDIKLVSLTITVYMVVQGLAPSFRGPLSDTQGRRITFVGTFLVYLISNVGLAFSNSFVMLMIFRGVQAAGSAATISIGAGVIGDITTARERGGFIGIFGGRPPRAEPSGYADPT